MTDFENKLKKYNYFKASCEGFCKVRFDKNGTGIIINESNGFCKFYGKESIEPEIILACASYLKELEIVEE